MHSQIEKSGEREREWNFENDWIDLAFENCYLIVPHFKHRKNWKLSIFFGLNVQRGAVHSHGNIITEMKQIHFS